MGGKFAASSSAHIFAILFDGVDSRDTPSKLQPLGKPGSNADVGNRLTTPFLEVFSWSTAQDINSAVISEPTTHYTAHNTVKGDLPTAPIPQPSCDIWFEDGTVII